MQWHERPEYNAQDVKGWRIYYGDGSTFDSSQGSWTDAPDEDVQIVMLYLERPYRNQVCAADVYFLPNGTHPKFGRAIPDEDFYAIQASAVADDRWPGEG